MCPGPVKGWDTRTQSTPWLSHAQPRTATQPHRPKTGNEKKCSMNKLTPIPRPQAIKEIATHLADRDTFVIIIPPDLIGSAAHALRHTDTTYYLDNGTPFLLCTSRTGTSRLNVPRLIAALNMSPTVCVATVPKTVPAIELSKALAQPIPEDGSQDVVILQRPGHPVVWPMVFVDALEIVDPEAAKSIRAADLAGLS